jgi:hypothetical protein
LWERFLPETLARLAGGHFFGSSLGARVIVDPIGQAIITVDGGTNA